MDPYDLMRLSLASKEWWHCTADQLAKRCSITINNDKPETEPRRKYEQVFVFGNLHRKSIPGDVKELVICDSSFTKPTHLKRFHKLHTLVLRDCNMVENSHYTGIKLFDMLITRHYPGFIHKNDEWPLKKRKTNTELTLENVVFEGLRQCNLKWDHKDESISQKCIQHLGGFLCAHPYLESLFISSSVLLPDMYRALTTLQKLSVMTINGPLTVEALECINQMPSLRKLEINNIETSDISKLDLTKISTFKCTMPTTQTLDCEFFTWLTGSPFITTLYLTDINTTDVLSLKALAKLFPNVKRLSIETDECRVVDCGKFNQLISLNCSIRLYQSDQLCIDCFDAPNLEYLQLNHSEINNFCIDHMATKFPKLQAFVFDPSEHDPLTIQQCYVVELLENLTNLSSLDVHCCVEMQEFLQFHNEYLDATGQSLPKRKFVLCVFVVFSH